MSGDFAESDWRVLRSVKDAALNRFCERTMEECRAVMDDRNGSAHERYLRLFKLIQEADEDLAHAFDDMRRTRAVQRISWIYYLKLFTDEEWERFSPQTRDTAQFLAGMIR
jgi:hypothetical protein